MIPLLLFRTLGVHSHGAPEHLFRIDSTLPRALFVVLEFPKLRRGELLEYGMHLAEEKAVSAVQETQAGKNRDTRKTKRLAWQMWPDPLLDEALALGLGTQNRGLIPFKAPESSKS